MELAIVFGVLTVFFLLSFMYYLDLILFYGKEKKRFLSQGETREYLFHLEERHKKKKHPQKKNFLLYLICLSCMKQGEEKKAKRLSAFLRRDILLGIEKVKEADQ